MSKRFFLTPATNGKPGQVVERELSDNEVQYLTPATADKAGELVTVKVVQQAEQQRFAEPVPYWQTGNDAGATGKLTPAEVSSLETERQDLIASLPRLAKGERSKVTSRIAVIEAELRRARGNAEADRVSREREQERPVQRYGASPSQQNKLTWESLRAHVAAMSGPAANERVCCVGKYLCSKCKAKAAA